MEHSIYGTWNGESFTKHCYVCNKEFKSKVMTKLRCDDCPKPKPPKDSPDCIICGQGLTRRYFDPDKRKIVRLCANHYYMVKTKHIPLQDLLPKEVIPING